MDKKTYTAKMNDIAEGKTVSEKVFAELTEFAKAKKLKRPPADAVTLKVVKEKVAKGPKAKCDPSLHGSDEACDKDSRSNGVCPAHYSRLVYRKNEANAEKVRQASRDYAERMRALKAEQTAASAAE